MQVAVVLVDQQVHEGLPHGQEVTRECPVLNAVGLHLEGIRAQPAEAFEERTQRPHDMAVGELAVVPIVMGRGVGVRVEEAEVDDATGLEVAHHLREAEEESRGMGQTVLLEQARSLQESLRLALGCGAPEIHPVLGEQVAKPGDGLAVEVLEAGFGDRHVERLVRSVAEEPGLFDLGAPVVGGAEPHVGLPLLLDTDPQRLVKARQRLDVEGENLSALERDDGNGDVDGMFELVRRAAGGQEIVLDAVGFGDSDDLELVAALADAEDDPATGGVGEGRDCLVGILGDAALRGLDLEVFGLAAAKPL